VEKLSKSNLDSKEHKELVDQLNYLVEHKTKLIEKIGKEITDINDSVTKNALYDPLVRIITEYKNLLSGLTVEQLGCLSNFIGFSIVFIILNSIFMIYFGDKIINYFNV